MKSKADLDRRTLREIEGSLTDKLAKLKDSVRSAVTQRYTTEAGRFADSAVCAAETVEEEIQVTLMDRQQYQVAQIEAALERLHRREYGLCEDCREFIGLARLRVLPFARRCRDCQSRAEIHGCLETGPLAAGTVGMDGR